MRYFGIIRITSNPKLINFTISQVAPFYPQQHSNLNIYSGLTSYCIETDWNYYSPSFDTRGCLHLSSFSKLIKGFKIVLAITSHLGGSIGPPHQSHHSRYGFVGWEEVVGSSFGPCDRKDKELGQ